MLGDVDFSKEKATISLRVSINMKMQLEAMAEAEKRSLSGQIEFLLEKTLSSSGE